MWPPKAVEPFRPGAWSCTVRQSLEPCWARRRWRSGDEGETKWPKFALVGASTSFSFSKPAGWKVLSHFSFLLQMPSESFLGLASVVFLASVFLYVPFQPKSHGPACIHTHISKLRLSFWPFPLPVNPLTVSSWYILNFHISCGQNLSNQVEGNSFALPFPPTRSVEMLLLPRACAEAGKCDPA